jgi:hypothetical protein
VRPLLACRPRTRSTAEDLLHELDCEQLERSVQERYPLFHFSYTLRFTTSLLPSCFFSLYGCLTFQQVRTSTCRVSCKRKSATSSRQCTSLVPSAARSRRNRRDSKLSKFTFQTREFGDFTWCSGFWSVVCDVCCCFFCFLYFVVYKWVIEELG